MAVQPVLRTGRSVGQHGRLTVELTLDVATTTALGPVQRARALERLADRLVDGALTVSAQEERSQLRNREIARKRLADVLAVAVAPPPPPGARRGQRRRRWSGGSPRSVAARNQAAPPSRR